MKTLKTLFKASCGKPVLALTGFWMICLGIGILFNTNNIPKNLFWLLLTFLTIWTVGYLFSVAARFAKNDPKPLKPTNIDVLSTFVFGFWTSLRLIFILSLLIVLEMVLYFIPNMDKYFEIITLTYMVLVVAPYLLFITVHADNLPWIKGLWSLFKKNAPNAFAFIFWLAFSFTVYSFLANYVLQFITSIETMFIVSFGLFVLFFWLLVFNAVLLGFYARKTRQTLSDPKDIEDKSETK